MNKQELMKELILNLKKPSVESFYERYLLSDSQGNTVLQLGIGVQLGKLSIDQALKLAVLVGIQWNEKFEGTP